MALRSALDRLTRVAPLIVLIGVAAGAWAVSAVRMDGMDGGPGGQLGATGWFMGTWVLMMAAMMVPVAAPLAVADGRRGGGSRGRGARTGAFVAAYLCVWAAAGFVAYELVSTGRRIVGGTFAWDHGGRWAAVAVLVAAALYQLTSRKCRSLERCRRTTGSTGAEAGLRAGVNCLASSWAMMAALFALGVMSLWWMGLVAVLIAAERLPRKPAPGRLAAAAVFLALGLGVIIVPASVPGLTIPGSHGAMKAMSQMSPGHASDMGPKGERREGRWRGPPGTSFVGTALEGRTTGSSYPSGCPSRWRRPRRC